MTAGRGGRPRHRRLLGLPILYAGALVCRHGRQSHDFEGLRAFKDKFDLDRRPVFVAVAADLGRLIGGPSRARRAAAAASGQFGRDGGSWLGVLPGREMIGETVEAPFPKGTAVAEPSLDLAERGRVHGAGRYPAPLDAGDEARAFENA